MKLFTNEYVDLTNMDIEYRKRILDQLLVDNHFSPRPPSEEELSGGDVIYMCKEGFLILTYFRFFEKGLDVSSVIICELDKKLHDDSVALAVKKLEQAFSSRMNYSCRELREIYKLYKGSDSIAYYKRDEELFSSHNELVKLKKQLTEEKTRIEEELESVNQKLKVDFYERRDKYGDRKVIL